MSAASALSGLRRRVGLRMLACCLDGPGVRNHVWSKSASFRAHHRVAVGGGNVSSSRRERIRWFASASAPLRPTSGAGSAATQVSPGGSPGPRQVQPKDPALKPLAAIFVVTTALGGGILWGTWEDGGREATLRVLRPAFEFLGLEGPDFGGAKKGGVQQRQKEQQLNRSDASVRGAESKLEVEQLQREAKDQESEVGAGREREDVERSLQRNGTVEEEGEAEQQAATRQYEKKEEIAEAIQMGKPEKASSVDAEQNGDNQDKLEASIDPQADVTMSEMAADLGVRLTKAEEEDKEEKGSTDKMVNEVEDAVTTDNVETNQREQTEEGDAALEDLEQNAQVVEEGENRGEVTTSAWTDAGKEGEKKDGEDFQELGGMIYGMMLKQEEAIRASFESRIQRLEEDHRQELNDERANAVRHAQKASTLEKELTKQKLLHAKTLKEQQQRDEEKRQREIHQLMEDEKRKLAETKVALEAKSAATVANERASRIEETDQVRMKLNALQIVFDGLSEESKQSLEAHKIAMGAFILEDALMRGQPLTKLAKVLEASAKDDPLVRAVVESLYSPEITTMGAPTRLQLWNKLASYRQTLKELAFLPRGGGGVLAHAVAKLGASLKVKEQDSDLEGGGIEAVLARVETLFVEGRLLEAASAIQEGVAGTRAEEVASHWVQLVRNRVVAEQAVAMLQAAATVMAAAST